MNATEKSIFKTLYMYEKFTFPQRYKNNAFLTNIARAIIYLYTKTMTSTSCTHTIQNGS